MDFDAIVTGGGHAGIEAALALARLGRSVLLITQNIDTIGKLSCNPAVGGLAKGNLVREIDALGGQMALLADATAIQFRMLNRSRGPAVQAPRAQTDKAAYAALARRTLQKERGITLLQDTVVDLVVSGSGREVAGVRTERGREVRAGAVVLTTGTFMEARIFVGEHTAPGGRLGEPAAVGLGTALRRLGFEVGRLKTGTPARVPFSTLDTMLMQAQHGDEPRQAFSFRGAPAERPSLPCYVTYTTQETHRVIRESLHRSPLYGGQIKGIGPRYCPSIEDKVVRFPQRERHQVFVEPEGLDTDEMYLNGLSSSLPEDVQERFLRTVPGLEQVRIVRPGYAVEYDYLDPIQLGPDLQAKRLKRLFVAGQTNGTSGYEEAAAQGLLAGINAALLLDGRPALILSRAESYIAVLIDDLVTRGTREPYRMFTSRAEYRLSLRHDTADQRLTPIGHRIGLQSDAAMEALQSKLRALDEVRELLRRRTLTAADAQRLPLLAAGAGRPFDHLLRRPDVSAADLVALDARLAGFRSEILEAVELDLKYEGYVHRQAESVRRLEDQEARTLPEDFDYDSVTGLSAEARQKLKAVRPRTLGQAGRISGVRQSDLTLLMIYQREAQE
jgi:tRNA uridine 5-carboxymethylaminomethyl modification enzyme